MPEGGALESACVEFKRHFLELHGGEETAAGERVDPDAHAPDDPTTPETLETE
jgi:hypothetical protein